jgi:hypothetical protein
MGVAQRNLFHLMGWLDAQLFRRAAAMRYGVASDAEPYTDPGKDHWRKVVVSLTCCSGLWFIHQLMTPLRSAHWTFKQS